jgi:hypothetical protein
MHVVAVPAAAQSPPQPAKADAPLGTAVRVTEVPSLNGVEQVGWQSMAAGLEDTLPLPLPPIVTVNVWELTRTPNPAVTDWAELIVTMQLPVPVHAPPHPVNVDDPLGTTLRVTAVPVSNDAEHVAPQAMPDGVEVTVPPPVPFLATLRTY